MTINLNERENRVLRAYAAAGIPTPLGHSIRRFYAAVRAALPAIEDGDLQHVGGKWLTTKDTEVRNLISMAISAIRIRSGQIELQLTKLVDVGAAKRIVAARNIARVPKTRKERS